MLQAARAVCLIHLQLLQAALDMVQEPRGPRAVLPEAGRGARGRGGGGAEARTSAPSLCTGSIFSPGSDGTGGTKKGDPTRGGPTPHPTRPCLLQSTYLGQRLPEGSHRCCLLLVRMLPLLPPVPLLPPGPLLPPVPLLHVDRCRAGPTPLQLTDRGRAWWRGAALQQASPLPSCRLQGWGTRISPRADACPGSQFHC